MKKIAILLLLMGILAACNTAAPPENSSGEENILDIAKTGLEGQEPMETIIDWVDFIQWNGKHYVSLDSAVLADPDNIGEKAGEVQFNVAANINSSSYQVKNGDAAFWDSGTELFHVKDTLDLLAVKDLSEVNGYRLYLSDSASDSYPHHFKDLELGAVNKIEIYDTLLYDEKSSPELLNEVNDERQVREFISFLTGEHSPQDAVLEKNPGDPDMYAAVLYSDEELARKFYIYFEGGQWLWYPWDREFLPGEIELFIQP